MFQNTSSVSSVMNYFGVFTTVCDAFEDYEDMEPEMLCAGNQLSGDMSCQGDVGGPMMCDDYLVGITSYGGYLCSDSTYPGVYTNVSNYLSWIIDNSSSSLTSNTSLIVTLLVAASMWKFH
uniref:Peptidase S1 domain-containing protein n=1 Tax=Timema cristinae TaxID=61476 RepID=A0A7R9D4V9_TIMCR|nr:unnamed protein product [Timema cristinae]